MTFTKYERRDATVEDVMRRMHAEPRYESYGLWALGWGMGPVQGIETALREAEKLGLVTITKHWRTGLLYTNLTEAGKRYEFGWTPVHSATAAAVTELFAIIKHDVAQEMETAHPTHADIHTDKGIYRIHPDGKVTKKIPRKKCAMHDCTNLSRYDSDWCDGHER